MEIVQVPITNSLKAFVDNQAAKSGFVSPGDYIQSVLIELEKREVARTELKEKLLEGVRSTMIEANEAFWRELEQELFDNHPELKSCE